MLLLPHQLSSCMVCSLRLGFPVSLLSPCCFADGIHPEDEAWQQVLDEVTPLLQRLLAAPSSQ